MPKHIVHTDNDNSVNGDVIKRSARAMQRHCQAACSEVVDGATRLFRDYSATCICVCTCVCVCVPTCVCDAVLAYMHVHAHAFIIQFAYRTCMFAPEYAHAQAMCMLRR